MSGEGGGGDGSRFGEGEGGGEGECCALHLCDPERERALESPQVGGRGVKFVVCVVGVGGSRKWDSVGQGK